MLKKLLTKDSLKKTVENLKNQNKKINNYKTAKQSDTKLFAEFHKSLLKNGIYFPPSQFEACFLSVAHSNSDIEKTIKIVNQVIGK